jgi:hypothetical protein
VRRRGPVIGQLVPRGRKTPACTEIIERGDDPPLAGPDVSDDDMSVTIIPKNDRPE